jgi:hypothetical protein
LTNWIARHPVFFSPTERPEVGKVRNEPACARRNQNAADDRHKDWKFIHQQSIAAHIAVRAPRRSHPNQIYFRHDLPAISTNSGPASPSSRAQPSSTMVNPQSRSNAGAIMISEKQLVANRRNALSSTGPRSAAAKQRVSLNNLRHGLTGQTTVLSPEDRAAHDEFCAAIMKCLKPANALELQIAQSIADDHWRLNRVFAIENNIFALGRVESPAPADSEAPEIHDALNSARVFLADAKQFALLSIYEQRIHRNLQKSAAQLNDLQTARKQQTPAPPTQPKAKPQPNPVNILPDRAAENGFGFANDLLPAKKVAGPVWNPTQSLKIGTVQAT